MGSLPHIRPSKWRHHCKDYNSISRIRHSDTNGRMNLSRALSHNAFYAYNIALPLTFLENFIPKIWFLQSNFTKMVWPHFVPFYEPFLLGNIIYTFSNKFYIISSNMTFIQKISSLDQLLNILPWSKKKGKGWSLSRMPILYAVITSTLPLRPSWLPVQDSSYCHIALFPSS